MRVCAFFKNIVFRFLYVGVIAFLLLFLMVCFG